jgi:hypothetical protein
VRLQAAHLSGQVPTEAGVAPHLLGRHPTHQALGLGHQVVQVLVGAQAQLAEAVEEGGEVGDGRIAKHLAFASTTAEPFRQMRHQLRKLTHKRLLSQHHGFFNSPSHAFLLLLVDLGADAHEVVG